MRQQWGAGVAGEELRQKLGHRGRMAELIPPLIIYIAQDCVLCN